MARTPTSVTRGVTACRRQAEAGAAACRGVVKRSDVLERVAAEADLPYEETALARRAPAARRRLALLLLLGAAGFALEAAFARNAAWLLATAALALTAWGVRKGRLGGLVAAGFAGLLALLVPLALLAVGPRDAVRVVTCLVGVAFGASLLPDVVLLARDAELQHAYGLWARRRA